MLVFFCFISRFNYFFSPLLAIILHFCKSDVFTTVKGVCSGGEREGKKKVKDRIKSLTAKKFAQIIDIAIL